jgi:hypothetical protein
MPRRAIPRIAAVEAGTKPLTLRVRWREGGESLVDVLGLVDAFRPFAPLRAAPDLFAAVKVGEHGTDVVWSDDIDMSTDTLWRLAQEQSGETITRF